LALLVVPSCLTPNWVNVTETPTSLNPDS